MIPVQTYSSFAKWYGQGRLASCGRTRKSPKAGYSANQVPARVFLKYMRMSPSAYRRTVRNPARTSIPPLVRQTPEERQ